MNTQVKEELLKYVELGQALQRLKSNEDFKLIIADKYVKDTLMNQSALLVDTTPGARQEILEEILSVNYLRKFLSEIEDRANNAMDELRASGGNV